MQNPDKGTPFDVLRWPRAGVTIHNVRLVDVQPDETGFEKLSVEYRGITEHVVGGGRWNEQWSRGDVGRFGHLVLAQTVSGVELPPGACYFRPYSDQTLRRTLELDFPDPEAIAAGRNPNVIGWSCETCPEGFRAPVGLIPGEGGRFEPDQTDEVKLRVPPEFVRECRQVRMTPEEVLRGFIADLTGILNYVTCPRADRYSSNGSDERDYAEAWFDRAYGMRRVDLADLEASDEEAEQRASYRDDLAVLLDDYIANGGKADELFDAVQALVDKQCSNNS